MSAESVLSALGLSELLAGDFLAVQLVILAATGALFAMSMALMILAARSAGGARNARIAAEAHLKSALDVVDEARRLSAHVERSASAPGRPQPSAKPIKVGARETMQEAEIEIIDVKHGDVKPSSAERSAGNRNLDAAKEAAILPRSLLGGLRRRRD